jgi:nucleolar protein 12
MKFKKFNKKKPAMKKNKPEPKPNPVVAKEDNSDSSSDDDDVPQAADPVKVNDTIISEMDEGGKDSEDENEAEKPKKKTPKKSKEKPQQVKQADEEPKKIAYDKSEEPRTVFCGNIPNGPNINETRVKDLFGEYGTVKSVRFRSDLGKVLLSKKEKKDCKNFIAYVVFEKEEDANSSIKLNGFKLLDNHLRVNMANNKKETFSNKGTIFVGNLPFDALESEVHEYFSQVGNIEYARKIANKGIAYVCFSKGVNLSIALKLNDKPFKGRRLRISRCESRDKQDKKKLFKKDEKTGRVVKQRVKKAHKLNEEVFMRGKSNNNPIIKKIKESQKAKYNKFTERNQLTKKELFRRGGKMDQNHREENREKGVKKKKFFGAKVDGIDKTKSKKSKVSKSLKEQKVIAKKLKSAAARVTSVSS